MDTLAAVPPSSDSTSLYRRHRPGSFDEVVGQQHVVRTLRNAVEQGKVHHAYLFVGSRGTGKTSMAKILARSLNCERGGPTVTPCGECESCVTIAAGTSVDVIEMDAASNRSVDDVRDLRERVAYAPAGGRWKVYILDEAHMLTKEAWNAFLKTLEEPPPNTVFVLATTEAHKVMATIADRCQRFDFQRPSLEQISEVVRARRRGRGDRGRRGRGGDDRPLRLRAASATRSARSTSWSPTAATEIGLDDVLQLLGAADAELLFGAVDAVVAEDPKAVLLGRRGDGALRPRPDPVRPRPARPPAPPARHPDGRRGAQHLRRHRHGSGSVAGSGPGDRRRRRSSARSTNSPQALTAVREGDDARMAVEIALLKAARPDLDPSTEGLLRRIERLEQQGRGRPGPRVLSLQGTPRPLR